jgi:splicing factor 3B subunit 3
LGKKKVLRKCETKAFPNCIIQIQVHNNRIVVSDIQESVHLAMYRHDVNQFFIFADDTLPRWLTCCIPLDQDTYAGGDKFGNFFIIRLPKHVSIDLEEDPTGNRLLVDKASLNGAPHKFDHIVHYHVGDIITSLNKTGLVFGGREVLIYTTLQGGIGCFVPFVSREDVEFFQLLEAHLRNENGSLVGRDHLWYRSYYMPVKNVIDGSLCEQFSILPAEKRGEISASFDRSPIELIKKIQDMRTNVAF